MNVDWDPLQRVIKDLLSQSQLIRSSQNFYLFMAYFTSDQTYATVVLSTITFYFWKWRAIAAYEYVLRGLRRSVLGIEPVPVRGAPMFWL